MLSGAPCSPPDLNRLEAGPHLELQGQSAILFGRYVLFQVWDVKPPFYDTTFYVIEQREGSPATVHATRATYYAVTIPVLMQLMEEAEFREVHRIEGGFFQPIIAGHKRK